LVGLACAGFTLSITKCAEFIYWGLIRFCALVLTLEECGHYLCSKTTDAFVNLVFTLMTVI